MLYRLFVLHICLCLAQTAQAGPWLREKGAAFLAVSFSTTYFLDTSSQTYLEYGLTDKMTIIADIGIARLRNSPTGGYTTLSFRRSILPADRTSKLAYELGVGTGWIGDEFLPHVRTGLSWGRGISMGKKSGWTTIESAVNWDLTNQLHVAKLDATLGINFTDVTAGMMQIYSAHTVYDSIATIAPSIIISPKNGKYRPQIGTESQIGNIQNSVLKLGLWRDF
ncbi:MAG: hypothetical protein ABJJ53_09715 [Sulfitobacter sp.]